MMKIKKILNTEKLKLIGTKKNIIILKKLIDRMP